VGIDVATRGFHVFAVDSSGRQVLSKTHARGRLSAFVANLYGIDGGVRERAPLGAAIPLLLT